MLISDINYLEAVVESETIEGSGAAALLASLNIEIDAQSDAAAVVEQDAHTSAQTGLKTVNYSSAIDLLGLT